MNFSKSNSLACICLFYSFALFSQNIPEIKVNQQDLTPLSKVGQAVKDVVNSGAIFKTIQVLELSKHQETASRSKMGNNVQVLDVNPTSLRNLIKNSPQQFSLSVPKNSRESIKLQLIKVNPLAEGFNVFTSSQKDLPTDYLPGVYYRGVVEGTENNSIASISFFENEVIGSFTYEGGNMIIQPSYLSAGELILFNDKDIPDDFHYNCFSDQLEKIKKPIQPRGFTSASNCVRVYIECDYALHQNKGGTTNTVNWITSVFNNLATLYANESITTTISEVFVWTTSDSYSTTSSVEALNQFKNARPTFNGDIAHLAALGGSNLGGVAWLDVLCSSYKYAYSNISASYSNVPTFSWTVEVMTHEMGHNLGSSHTQWCGWDGGALDNCYTTEGGCSAGPAPTNGGTIMSYCHLTSYGINFNNGFGTQPGNKIRTEVAAATCLSSGCGGGGTCNAPSGLAISNITTTTASGSWNSVSGALSYSFEYKLNSSSNWTAASTSSTNYNLTGLSTNSLYNARVKTVCSSGSSSYSATINFTTSGGGACGIPTNFAVANISTSTATISWNAVAGATSYLFQYKLASGTTWSQVSTGSAVINMTGMNTGTSYSVRVQALCGTNQSEFTSVVTFTTQLGYCVSKGLKTTYEWIKRVNLESIDRVSGPDGGYFNATNLIANVVKGSTYTLNYQSGTTGSSGTLYWKIWIDFNNNSSFEDAGESIITNASSSTGLLSSTFTIPANASIANVRMRVSMKYSGYATSCMTFSYGEVEDYSINIQGVGGGGDVCAIPSGLAISNINTSSSTANWNVAPAATSYSIEYKLNSESSWTILNTTTTNYNLTGLISNTLYNTRVKSNCTSGSSDYSQVVNFTTQQETCNTPTNLNVSSITKTSSTANWNAVAGATSYSFEYKLNSGSSWTAKSTTTANYNLTGLNPNTTYNTRVKSICTSGSSEYSTAINFTTENQTCDVPANLVVTNIANTTATGNWNAVSGATSYNFEYKPNSGDTWTVINTTSTVYNATGLNENTLYDIRVKANCSFGSGDYSITLHFTTTSGISCGIPTNLASSNLSLSSATISWNATSGATSYNLQYKPASSSTWSVVNTTNTFVTLSGMSPSTEYNVRVQSICGVIHGEFTSMITFKTLSEYCISKGKSANYEWIKRVNLGTIDRISGKDAGYFNASNLITDVVKGSSYTINYQSGTSGSSGTLYWRIWIDFNNNNSFEDAGEMIVSLASASTGLLSSTFTIPSSAVLAKVRMRVSLKYSGYSTSCLSFSYGEVEDYSINILSSGGLVYLESEKEKIENIKLYPNPFTNNFNLEFFANQDQEVQMNLLDQMGRLIFSKPLYAKEGDNIFHIESLDFIPATYLIQIKSANDTYIRKICKLE